MFTFQATYSTPVKPHNELKVEYISLKGLKRGWYVTLEGRVWIVSAMANKLKLNPETLEEMLITNGAIKSAQDTLHFSTKEEALLVKESLEMFTTLNKD